ncbi:MAG TPA: VOC family protein [Trueperaceae bacterium]|nr:VOC family protein [Trueperaceae bacterium]
MKLPPETRLGTVTLAVSDLARTSAFYEQGVGLDRLEASTDEVLLGSRSEPLLRLLARPDLPPAPRGSAGLYHTAVLFEERSVLAAALQRAATTFPESFTGSADHLVSLAFYFSDPEGNGVELYWDRPRDEWRWQDGSVAMDTLPVDPNSFIAEHRAGEGELDAPLEAEATIGHVHLKVGEIPAARAFYVDALGFGVTVDTWPSALFVSAGGYHHHVGMNVWESRGAGPREPTRGLHGFEILVPDEATVDGITTRLERAAVDFERSSAGLSFRDPWNTNVEVRVEPT